MKIMEVEIISKGSVQPSSPTPPHLRTYKISLLDQFLSHSDIPVILYYPNQNPDPANGINATSRRSLLLKQSLSETLTRFYPLAGKFNDDLSIDCDDGGACYVEARANIDLRAYLDEPDLAVMNKLLPREVSWYKPRPGIYTTSIQETTFACGGFTIGVLVSHKIMDGIALASFLKDWAATASKSSEEIIRPNLDSPLVFPQYSGFPKEASISALIDPFSTTGKLATTRILFDASAIASLKAEAKITGMENPTRVEVVSALLSKSIMAALKRSGSNNKPIAFTHMVNLRPRAMPPFPQCSMGNFLWLAPALCSSSLTERTSFAGQLREAIRNVDKEFVQDIQGDKAFVRFYEKVKEMGNVLFSNGMDYVGISSWCNFGLYGIDFGWGKPIWATYVALSGNLITRFMKLFILMDSRIENGIEAWVFLDEQDIALLQKDKDLLAYASLNPSPLKSSVHA